MDELVANLNGVVFDQVYGDNSGGPEFDSDGDGTATQEDEFVSFTNTTGAAVDVSGWQVWSDSTGSGAPDVAQDGLYHTFPPGTVIAPGDTLYVINEISGTEPDWAQEASEGGVESGGGGTSTNMMTEGSARGSHTESVVLVDPESGDYIVFNMATSSSTVPSQTGFPGKNAVGEVDGSSVQSDQAAGESYQYNTGKDSYEYSKVFVPCFARGTRIRTPQGDVGVETLQPGDLVCTLDHGPQPVRHLLLRNLSFADGGNEKDLPILIQRGAISAGLPSADLVVSPQHRMLITLPNGREVLAPAKGLLHLPGIRVKRGMRQVQYIHIVFANHEVVFGNDAPSESFFGGPYALASSSRSARSDLPRPGQSTVPARPILRVREVGRHF